MEQTGSETYGLAKRVAIQEVKLLKFDVKLLQIVIYSQKPTVADKRNRAALENRSYGSQTTIQKEGMSRLFKRFQKTFLHSCIKGFVTLR